MKQFLNILLISISFQAVAQYDSSFRFYYYDQKLSIFEQMPAKDNCIIWLGDSITDGCEWSELFPNYNNLNRGVSSDNTFGVLNRLPEVIRRKPAKVFILIGINDIARNIPADVILKNYSKIVDRLQQESPRTKIYVQSLLPTNNQFTQFKNHQNKEAIIEKVNQGIEQLAIDKKINFINLHTAFQDEAGKLDPRFTNDGLHLTGAGYLRWKEVLLKGKYL